MIYDTFAILSVVGIPSILLLDSYFLSVPLLEAIKLLSLKYGDLLTIVTKAKDSYVAFEEPPGRTGRRGRPRIKGRKVWLSELFVSEKDSFITTKATMYGKLETVNYFVKDLLWGEGLNQRLRFVLVAWGTRKNILVSTDLSLSPISIIELYSKRFKIECCFREFNQVIAGFACRFWSAAMPKLDRFVKNSIMRERLKSVPKELQPRIVGAFKATEGFVMMACIALGMLQLVSLNFGQIINVNGIRWLRTVRNILPSEATVADFIRKRIILGYFLPDLEIAQLIQSVQSADNETYPNFDDLCG